MSTNQAFKQNEGGLPQGVVVHDLTRTHFVDLTHTCDLCSEDDDCIHAQCTTCSKSYCKDCYINMTRAFTAQGRDTSTCPFCMQPSVVVQLFDDDDE